MSSPVLVYTPVLRWKRGESAALSSLSVSAASAVRPLIERVPPTPGSGGTILHSAADFGRFLRRQTRVSEVLLDPVNWAPDTQPRQRAVALHNDLVACWNSDIDAIPVVGLLGRLEEGKSLSRMLGERLRRVALRVDLLNLASERLIDRIDAALNVHRTPATSATLLLDFGEYHESHPSIEDALARVLRIGSWLEVVFVCGAFPASGALRRHSESRPARSDWSKWRAWHESRAIGAGQSAARFGDYTTQNATYRPPPPRCTPAVTSKYTRDDHWVVSRGTTLELGGSSQWSGLAQQMVMSDGFSSECCAGCAEVAAVAASNGAQRGNFSNWLSYSVTHHIERTVRQLRALVEGVSFTTGLNRRLQNELARDHAARALR